MVLNNAVITGVFVGIALWLGLLSALLVRTLSHYNRLMRGASGRDLHDALERLMRELRELGARTQTLEKTAETLVTDGGTHVKKIGIVRFNPFADTGGAQSFTVAMLDSMQNGIVMTSLYARTGNRWYIKEVARGRGKALELSKEEKSAIDRAESGGGSHE